MAFVFRSQKQSLFLPKKDQIDPPKSTSIGNQQSQLNGTTYTNMASNPPSVSPSKIVKGLPSLLKKSNSPRSDNFKQNQFFQEGKQQIAKGSHKQSKKVTSNYFFTSNVPRDINKASPKLLDKSLTCSQFNASTNDQISILEQKKPFMTNYLSKNFAVNKSLLAMEQKIVKDFRKPPSGLTQKSKQVEQILIDCSKDQNPSIKRKSSPPHGFDKTSYNSVLQKLKSQKEKNQQNRIYDQGELYMKTFEEGNPLKKCPTQKKLSKLHKGNMQSSFYKESQSQESGSEGQEEYTTPGPGSYDNTVNLKQMKSFRSKKDKFTKIFGSLLERFIKQEVKYHEVTYVNEQNPPKNEKQRRNHVFVSNTPKFMPLEKKSPSPQPGFYNPRESLEHDIVRNLLRNANIASFNSTLPRFKQEKFNLTPGPGQYNVDCLELAKLEEIRNQLSSCYKSQVQRCLDYVKQSSNEVKKDTCTIQGLMDKKHKNYVIHKRQQNFDSSEFYSPPAFFSGVERFKDIKKETGASVVSSSLHSKTFSKEQKNVQPFNSTEERKLSQTVGQGVGVGSYLVDKDKWNKKSYNIFFH